MPRRSSEGSNGDRSLDVLIVSQPAEYGVAIYVRQLAKSAVEAGHDVTVISPSASRGPLATWVTSVGARHHALDMARRPALRDPFDLLTIRRLARGRDVIHVHSSKASALGRVAAATLPRRVRPAVVMTPHYWSWLVGGRLEGLYRSIERLLARRCDAIVAVSEGEEVEGRSVLGPDARLTLIPNGVDREHFSPEGVSAERDADHPLIVCVGRLSEQKGQDIAIRALALLSDRTSRLRLVGAESTPGHRRELEELATSLGVADRIEWRGHVDDTAPEYRAADVVIAPSRWEGMSLASLEALSCGSAMVVTDVSGSEALGAAAVIVPREDPGAIARAIDGLLHDPAKREQLQLAARTQSRPYDVSVTMRRNLELWTGLVLRGTGKERPPARPRTVESAAPGAPPASQGGG
jgi:glycosyltransferase involved in cell wall biosynthesis